MDDFFKQPVVLFSFYSGACYILTFLTRRIVEAARPDWKKQADENSVSWTYTSTGSRWWNTVILYALAPVFGVLLAIVLKGGEYFPESFRDTAPAIMFGLIAGFMSGLLYKVLKKMILARAGVGAVEPAASDPPASGG